MKETARNTFHKELYALMDEYVHSVYDYSRSFPKEEMFGVTAQLRRAALSVILNYIEGYARKQKGTLRHFLEMSYGSLKESKYLVEFAHRRGYIGLREYQKLMRLADQIGAMLWGTMSRIK